MTYWLVVWNGFVQAIYMAIFRPAFCIPGRVSKNPALWIPWEIFRIELRVYVPYFWPYFVGIFHFRLGFSLKQTIQLLGTM